MIDGWKEGRGEGMKEGKQVKGGKDEKRRPATTAVNGAASGRAAGRNLSFNQQSETIIIVNHIPGVN